MTDLTSTLSTILVEKHSSKPISKKAAQLHVQLDSFLREAYQINRSIQSLLRYLRAIRQPYLSTAPPPKRIHSANTIQTTTTTKTVPGFGEIPVYLTDAQREDIDSRTAVLLRDFDHSISNLKNAAILQSDTAGKVLEKKYGKPNGVLWRWAGGDANDGDSGKSEMQLREEGMVKSLGLFREGVVWFLNKGLKDAVAAQGEMVEIRLEREQEKRMSVLYDEKNKGVKMQRTDEDDVEGLGNRDVRGRDTYNPALDSNGQGQGMSELSAEQLQLFEEENSSLLNHYTDTLKKVTQAEKSLMEISSLQQTLVGHLTVQGEMIGQLVEDASRTDENVKRGNKELKKASERGSVARGVFWGTVGLCSFLVVWDLIF